MEVYAKYAYNFKSVYEFWTGVINFSWLERTQELTVRKIVFKLIETK